MPWIKVVRDFTFKHTNKYMKDYKKDCEYRVTTRCANMALSGGYAVYSEIEIKRRKEWGYNDTGG